MNTVFLVNRFNLVLRSLISFGSLQCWLVWLHACVGWIVLTAMSVMAATPAASVGAATEVESELWRLAAAPSIALSAADYDTEIDVEKGLQSVRRAVWYDPETKGYAPPKIAPERDSEIRTGGKVSEVKASGTEKSWWDWFSNWNWGGANFFSNFFSWTMLVIIASVLVIAVVALLFYTFRDYLPQGPTAKVAKRGIEIDLARVEELPFDVRAMTMDPLAEAQRLMRAGNYDAAIVYLYGYMLLALDQARKLHLQKGKTNRMYLRELNRVDGGPVRPIVESTMLAFEQVYFGKHPLSAEHFQVVWGQVDEFNRLLHRAAAAEPAQGSLEIATT